tara:strand:- start:46 stop:801 length:756 start_codon:yes stop_codon:yes gene_type:complete
MANPNQQPVLSDVHIDGSITLSGTVILDEIDLTIKAGQWTALLGPSGSGKSTLLRLIAGLDTAADFNGSITSSSKVSLSGHVSYMAQDDLLLDWADVIHNVCLGSTLRGRGGDKTKAKSIIQKVGLSQHAQKRPQFLSGGQRQRVALARTLMEQKPIILLDEPFSALDARTRTDMQDLAAEQFKEKTVVLVTHDPCEAVRLCQSIYLLQDYSVTCIAALSPPFPKPIDDNAMFALQSALMAQIRQSKRADI